MRRIDVYVEDITYISLKGLPGTISDHVKRALEQYLKDMYKINVSGSKSKVGDYNG